MRIVRIFTLHFQYLLAHRSRSLVYIFTYVFAALLYLAFIRGVFASNNSLEGWTVSSATSYYLLLILAPALLMTHPEIPVLRDDIEKGEIAGRLLKPFPYYWQRFYHELPYRLFQGLVGLGIYIYLSIIFGNFLKIHLTISQIAPMVLLIVLAYFISFTFKMIVALVAFWTTDTRGLYELVDVLIIIFGGVIVPINLLPTILERASYILPFSYIIYFPIIAVQGKLSESSLTNIIASQLLWLLILTIVFRIFWKRALMRFTDLGH